MVLLVFLCSRASQSGRDSQADAPEAAVAEAKQDPKEMEAEEQHHPQDVAKKLESNFRWAVLKRVLTIFEWLGVVVNDFLLCVSMFGSDFVLSLVKHDATTRRRHPRRHKAGF